MKKTTIVLILFGLLLAFSCSSHERKNIWLADGQNDDITIAYDGDSIIVGSTTDSTISYVSVGRKVKPLTSLGDAFAVGQSNPMIGHTDITDTAPDGWRIYDSSAFIAPRGTINLSKIIITGPTSFVMSVSADSTTKGGYLCYTVETDSLFIEGDTAAVIMKMCRYLTGRQ